MTICRSYKLNNKANNINSDCDSMDSNRNMGDASSLGLQSLESNTFDMGDREAEKDDECKNVIFTNTMAANLSNPN